MQETGKLQAKEEELAHMHQQLRQKVIAIHFQLSCDSTNVAWKNHFYEMKGDVGMSVHEKERKQEDAYTKTQTHS